MARGLLQHSKMAGDLLAAATKLIILLSEVLGVSSI